MVLWFPPPIKLTFNEHVLDFAGHHQSVLGSPEQDWLPLKFIQKSSDTSRKCILVAVEDEPTCTCRRTKNRLVMASKIQNMLIENQHSRDTSTRRGQHLRQQHTNKDLYRYSFVPREWSVLSD
jgi:hypothetical protein